MTQVVTPDAQADTPHRRPRGWLIGGIVGGAVVVAGSAVAITLLVAGGSSTSAYGRSASQEIRALNIACVAPTTPATSDSIAGCVDQSAGTGGAVVETFKSATDQELTTAEEKDNSPGNCYLVGKGFTVSSTTLTHLAAVVGDVQTFTHRYGAYLDGSCN